MIPIEQITFHITKFWEYNLKQLYLMSATVWKFFIIQVIVAIFMVNRSNIQFEIFTHFDLLII